MQKMQEPNECLVKVPPPKMVMAALKNEAGIVGAVEE